MAFDLSEFIGLGEEFNSEHVAKIRESLGQHDFNAFCEVVFTLSEEMLADAPEDRRVIIQAFKKAVLQ
jgi:hypothetical protein